MQLLFNHDVVSVPCPEHARRERSCPACREVPLPLRLPFAVCDADGAPVDELDGPVTLASFAQATIITRHPDTDAYSPVGPPGGPPVGSRRPDARVLRSLHLARLVQSLREPSDAQDLAVVCELTHELVVNAARACLAARGGGSVHLRLRDAHNSCCLQLHSQLLSLPSQQGDQTTRLLLSAIVAVAPTCPVDGGRDSDAVVARDRARLGLRALQPVLDALRICFPDQVLAFEVAEQQGPDKQ
jgi:hypothetical protein